MNTHIIKNNVVVNTILATVDEAKTAYPDAVCVDASLGGAIGDAWDGEKFSKPATDHSMLKSQKWDAIKAERDRRRFDGGVKVGDHWFLSTSVATSEYASLTLLSTGLPDTTVLRAAWRTMDGAAVDMTPALVKQIMQAGFAQIAAIDDAAQAHRAAMEASADPASYNFSQNAEKTAWPVIFGE